MQGKLGLAQSQCYRLFHESVAKGVIDERPDGYFHDLPPILLKCPYVITPDQDNPRILLLAPSL